MYKKLVSFLVFSLYAPLAAFSADDPSRARLYIPASTNAEVSGCVTCEIKASGYSAHYVFGFGLGLGVASSKLAISGDPDIADYSLDTGPMMDIGYTFGSDFTFTVGFGVGSSPTTDIKIPDTEYVKDWKLEGTSASNFFLGLGYNFGIFEVLLALRSVSTSYDHTYTVLGTQSKSQTTPSWSTTDIGIGFTF